MIEFFQIFVTVTIATGLGCFVGVIFGSIVSAKAIKKIFEEDIN